MKESFKEKITRFLVLMSVLNMNRADNVCAEAWECAIIATSDKSIKAACTNGRQGRV